MIYTLVRVNERMLIGELSAERRHHHMNGALSRSNLTPENSHSCLSILSSW